MNERIRELAKEADPDHWHKRWYSGINPRVMDPEIKKFVELIVLECADAAYQSLYEDRVFDDSPFNIRLKVMDAIKKHFGVTE